MDDRRTRLIVARALHGWTLAHLADAAECNLASVRRWLERGDPVGEPPMAGHAPVTTARLAAAMGLPAEALTPGSDLRPGFAHADSVVIPGGYK